MKHDYRLRWILVLAGLFVGCHSSAPATPDQRVSHSDQTTIDSLAEDIRTAPDAISEANALKRFRQHAVDHGYTYRVHSYRPGSRIEVFDAAARNSSVVTEVAVYHADEHVTTFTFSPRDNHNIYLIAKGS